MTATARVYTPQRPPENDPRALYGPSDHPGTVQPRQRELSDFTTLEEYVEAAVGGRVREKGERASRVSEAMGQGRARALAENVLAGQAGVNQPDWVRDVTQWLIDVRPLATALGGAQPITGRGMSLHLPSYAGTIEDLVDTHEDLDSVLSVAAPFGEGGGDLVTVAGGARNSLQVIERSGPSYRESWGHLMLAGYGRATEARLASELDAAATVTTTAELDTDAPESLAVAVSEASGKVEAATGSPATVVVLDPASWPVMGGLGDDKHQLYPGRIVDGIPVVMAKATLTHPALATNKVAAQWWETGPMFRDAAAARVLGRDVVVYGLGHTGVSLPRGVVAIPAA